MNEINSVDKIFLRNLENLLLKFNEIDKIVEEIDKMIEEHPDKQSQSDKLLSDYYHMLENDDLGDIELVNIGKKMHDARIYRRNLNRANALMGCYKKHKEKIRYSIRANREFFRQAIKKTNESLHEDYQYRILTENDIKNLSKNDDIKIIKNTKRKYTKAPTKKELEKCLKDGMKLKDIGNKFGIRSTYISVLKKKYGLNKKD